MLTSTQSAGVTPVVKLRITQGIHPGFETQGRQQSRGISGPQKGLMFSNFLKKSHVSKSQKVKKI